MLGGGTPALAPSLSSIPHTSTAACILFPTASPCHHLMWPPARKLLLVPHPFLSSLPPFSKSLWPLIPAIPCFSILPTAPCPHCQQPTAGHQHFHNDYLEANLLVALHLPRVPPIHSQLPSERSFENASEITSYPAGITIYYSRDILNL